MHETVPFSMIGQGDKNISVKQLLREMESLSKAEDSLKELQER